MEKEAVNNITQIDKTTFELLFKHYFSALSYYAYKFIPDIDTAKEIVHDVFINVWEKRDVIDLSKSVKAYLYTSVHNRCLNHLRDHKKFNRDEILYENLSESQHMIASDRVIEAELKAKINEVMQMLPEKCREVFEMSRFHGLKYNEIAVKLNISVKTVEAQMSKALKIFREQLQDYLPVMLLLYYY